MLQLLSALVGIFILSYLIDRTVSEKFFACLKDYPEAKEHVQRININCSDGKVLQIKESLYGKSQYNYCIHTSGDCIEQVTNADHCCGLKFCDLDIRRVYSIRCASFVTFFRLIYHCIIPSESKCRGQREEQSASEQIPEVISLADVVPIMGNTDPVIVSPTETTPTTAFSDPSTVRTHVDNPASNLTVILGSAALVALLLASIVAIIFLLRKYQWQSEKECFLQLFMGMCTREPPDGSEDPDGVASCSQNTQEESTPQSSLPYPGSSFKQHNEQRMDMAQARKLGEKTIEHSDEKLKSTPGFTSQKQNSNRKRKRGEFPEVKFLIKSETTNKDLDQSHTKREQNEKLSRLSLTVARDSDFQASKEKNLAQEPCSICLLSPAQECHKNSI